MTGEHWYGTFRNAFTSGDQKLITSVLDTICKTEHKDGMVAASQIAAAFEVENEEMDSPARNIAREILTRALEKT